LYSSLYDQVSNDKFQDSIRDDIEDILVEYYDLDLGAIGSQKFDMMEDFLWADIGQAALQQVGQAWGKVFADAWIEFTREKSTEIELWKLYV